MKTIFAFLSSSFENWRYVVFSLLFVLVFALGTKVTEAEIIAVETAPAANIDAPAIEPPAPFAMPQFEPPARPKNDHETRLIEGETPNGEPLLIRVGVLAYSPPWYDGAFVDETLRYLSWRLPQYDFKVDFYAPEALREAIRSRQIDLAAASTTFFHAERMPIMRELAAIVSDTASDPSRAAAATVVVRTESSLQSIADLKGKRVAVVSDEETPGLYEVLYEASKLGFDADAFFSGLVKKPPLEMQSIIDDVIEGRVEAGILRACFLEDLWRAGSVSYEGKIRVLGKRSGDGLACYHSTGLYPGWTFVSSETLPQHAARDITAVLLTKPQNAWGQYWSVSTDHSAVLEMYKALKLGPYAYLREWTLERIWAEYWVFFVIGFATLLSILVHGVVLEKLVRRRTRELERVHAEQQKAQRSARELTEKLDALQRAGAVGQISSIVAHEMKQPLAVIQNLSRGTLRILEDEEPALGDAAEAVEAINREAGRAAEVIDRVRAYGKGRADRERLDLAYAVRDVVEKFRASGKAQGVEIGFSDMAAGEVLLNPIDLELIVINLLSNAVEASSSRSQPKVTVAVDVELGRPTMMRLSVADNGPDLSEAAFAALGRTVLKSGRSHGLGLGLLIVKSLTEAHVGRLAFERGASGGTVAIVRLPKAMPIETQADEGREQTVQKEKREEQIYEESGK